MKEIVSKSAKQIHEALSNKEITASEVLHAHLDQIDAWEHQIGAFNVVTVELAKKQAAQIDKLQMEGKVLPPLAGLPCAIKDNICLPGYPTTCSSKILFDYFSPYQAEAASRLFAQGAVCLGKTNMDEFAMGSSTENSAFKTTLNPWSLAFADKKFVPGGSSGGSAAAVAAGFCPIAVGSDTGGSIRQPAAFCGVVGMKPTYGLVSRYGLVAFASSLDQIGPIARSVEDAACVLAAIAGHDHKDSTSYSREIGDLRQFLGKEIKGMKIGLISELVGEGIDDDVREGMRASVETFEKLGANLEEVSLPYLKHALPVYYLIATAEASANLARYDGVKYGLRSKEAGDLLSMYYKTRQEGFGDEVKRRIMLGTFALSSGYYDAYYKKAGQVRRLIKEDFEQAFAKFDLLLCPTAPTPAFEFGAKTQDPLSMYLSDIATIPVNLAGLPALSLPCGFNRHGLPIGLQIIGPQLADARVLQAAYAYEAATKFTESLSPALKGKQAQSTTRPT